MQINFSVSDEKIVVQEILKAVLEGVAPYAETHTESSKGFNLKGLLGRELKPQAPARVRPPLCASFAIMQGLTWRRLLDFFGLFWELDEVANCDLTGTSAFPPMPTR